MSESRLPLFLRREYIQEIDPQIDEFIKLQEKYKEQFGDYPTTEPSVYGMDDWIRFLKECLEKNITVFELLPGELEEGNEEEHEHIIITE